MCGVRLLRPIPRALGPEDDDDAMTCRFRASAASDKIFKGPG